MIRIALVTTWFPPQKGVAVNRMFAFANYLSENLSFQIDVYSLGEKNIVLQLKNNLTNYQFRNNDFINYFKANSQDSFFVHNSKTVIRILLSKLKTRRYKNWSDNTSKQLEINHSEIPYSFIISSYAPEEAHLIALNFVKKNKVFWIADMRDEMSKNFNISKSGRERLREIELQVNQYATCLTSVSEPILADFKQLCPNIQIFEEIRNGFDHTVLVSNWKFPEDNILKIGYFGTFYADIKPDVFFNSFIEIEKKLKGKVEFHFYGVHKNFTVPKEIEDRLKFFPSVSYQESIVKMAEMDANLLILPKGERKGVYSGKIFDYLSTKRPILAYVDLQDVAASLITNFNAGYVIDYNDNKKGSELILRWVKDLESGIVRCATDEQILSLHRKFQVNKLEEIILNLL
jgi:glycosyltransferase involved in cell wall biosynthesis